MSEVVGAKPLSEAERVVDMFMAPSLTFADILRSTTWWLPFVLLVVVTTAATFTIDREVGFQQVAENQIHLSPKQEEALNSLPPADRATRVAISAKVTKYISYASPVLILLFSAIGALVLWGSFNFGLGARTSFGQMFAVWIYASLPRLLSGVLEIVTLCFGNNADSFNLKEPVGTNVGYYMADSAPWLRTGLGFLDVIGIWNMVLLIIGTAVVAKVKMGSAAAVIVGWWLLVLLLSVGASAAFN
ncbi:YIP1 family protein [Granulicella sibirica]|uniref:Yip1 domain-containing protein n=1 Tax=Granulicella sibirica TaxID=2479048 RepID=A0A4Q0T753_9BACT|nr:YIP1 family protein [Granulicella sibirica]RXH58872.1 hypothetical protein GRAN_2182 [Granulicella sibirica]